jgi:predicted nucleic acid binding AN1-type Zn finger protein
MADFYFAWVDEGDVFDAVTHAREDAKIFSIELSQDEGEFAKLAIQLENPRVGLLAAGRNLWCILSRQKGDDVEHMFTGRLIGIPSRVDGEVVELTFVARPADFLTQRDAVSDALKELPWYDEVWLDSGHDDPNTVLETRCARWNIDRLSLEVSTTNIVDGEAGTIELTASQHFYDDFDVSYSEDPKKSVEIKATATWDEEGEGDVDITRPIVEAFQATGSQGSYPIVTSLTGDGLLSSWPKGEANIGGGWAVGKEATIEDVTGKNPTLFVKEFASYEDDIVLTTVEDQVNGLSSVPYDNYRFSAKLGRYKIYFPVHYTAKRARTETIAATVTADIQNLVVDPDADDTEKIEVSTSRLTEALDADDAMPIGDKRNKSYFKLSRGEKSFQNLLLWARAKLLSSARCIEIKVTTWWDTVSQITCQHNVLVYDDRLPNGQALGKVKSYTFRFSADDGEQVAEITLGCTIGHGTALAAAAAGDPIYVADGYVSDGYVKRTGAAVELLESELQYESFDGFEISDDDGVDLFNMTAKRCIESITVEGGNTAQRAAIQNSTKNAVAKPDPGKALQDLPTTVTLVMKPVDADGFKVDFTPDVSDLVIPKTIDLEAA